MSDSITNIDVTSEQSLVSLFKRHPNRSELSDKLKEVKEAAAKARNLEVGNSSARRPIPESQQDTAGDYDWIDARFEPFFKRPPSAVYAMTRHLRSAKTPLHSGGMTSFNSVESAVDDWGGAAQRHFMDYFISPFPLAVTNQQAIIEELNAGLLCYAEVLREGQVAALEIAIETTNSLDALSSGIFGDDGGIVALSVLAAAAGVASAIPTGGFGITLAIIGGGSGIGGTIAGLSGDEEKPISGGTVEEVLQSMQDTLDKLKDNMEEAEKAIATDWTISSDTIADKLRSVSDNSKSSILPHEPTNDGIPNLTSGDSVSTDPQDGDFKA
ncbi:MAG TPA: hypothetical protein H9902_00090 [Candidatus Stackebrandtia faecavium]|nr:hypothetical protein [Candidatus Stackebrandtia faecavium]